MAITGNGRAAKEQVAYMLQKILHIPDENMLPQLDASDGLAAALCHFYQSNITSGDRKYKEWKDFVNHNQDKVRK
jgi:crossover junction endodeoxyribonuclease RuvC